jgi:hypothetical protein
VFQKDIEFSTHEDYFAQKEDYPIPSKLNIPEWYKKLDHNINNLTVKGCMPFLDSLTAGYLLKMPQDLKIDHNVLNKNNEPDSFSRFGLSPINSPKIFSMNLNGGPEVHPTEQVKGSPLIEKNKNMGFYKILNPWVIKTPKGYSCLFVPPLNNSDDRFSIIPGIVDTDSFDNEINFPIVINGDKYPVLNTIIKKGLPYVQVIPFKRESWKMETKSVEMTKIENQRILHKLFIWGRYKNTMWNKKLWK